MVTFLGQQRVLAHHQPLAGIVRAADLGHIACVEQGELQRPGFAASCWIAGPRSAVIQSSPAGRSVCSIRALVSMPRSPTSTTWRSRKRCFSLVIWAGDGRRIGGIAFEHLDRDRTAIRGTQQADHQLRPVAAAVAAVAVAGPADSSVLRGRWR